MSPTDHRQRVRHAFEEMSSGNPGAFLELLAPDVDYTVIGDTQFSGAYRGVQAFLDRVATPLLLALAGPLRLEVRNLVSDADGVTAQVVGTSTLRSGAAYNNTYCWVFRFAGERAAAVTEYLDTALVNRAFGVPAEREALLQRMDLNMWEMFREIVRRARGGELLETRGLWMGANPRGGPFHNMLMVCDHLDVETVLAAIRTFYAPRQRPFSVCVRAHADAGLEAALRARGFTDFTVMPGMALLSDPGTPAEPAGVEIRPAIDDQGRRDYTEVSAAAYATYGAPRAYMEDAFAHLDSVCAPHIQGFVAYVNGTPAAAAAVYVTHGVGGIGWVGTVPEFRQRGYGEAVTWAAVREGLRRGASFASLQASPMGRPIYERMGFMTATEYRVLLGRA